jgi:hypothetical protein
MALYLVTFVKRVLNSSGHEFTCVQREVVVRHARSVDRAVKAAERWFEHIRHIPYWKLHADRLELKIDGRKVDFEPKDDDSDRMRWLRFVPGAGAKPRAQ